MNKLKVIIAGLFVACLSIGVVSAQDKAAGTTAKKSTTKAKPAKSTEASTTADGKTAKPTQHLKKDGTPDKRYKENKTAGKKSTGTKKAASAPGTTGK